MMDERPAVSLSAMDEQRFGIITAKAALVKKGNIPGVMEFCEENRVEFLIARCPTFDLGAVQELERLGFLLMDTLLYFSFDLQRKGMPEDTSGGAVRKVREGDERGVRAVAEECFRGYSGHYHADPRLDRKKCDEVYTDWAYRACLSRNPDDGMLAAVSGDDIAGFGTLHVNGGTEGEGGLFCVAPSFRGRGVYRSIMIHCLRWCADKSLERMIISTQVTNYASQKAWCRLGFEPSHSFYTFHKWFEPQGKGGIPQP